MNRKTLTTLVLAGVTGILANTAASADPARLNPVYGDELQRCVVALRGEATDAGAASVRHTVTAQDVRGLWREFTIESELAAPGGVALGETVSRCRTERWGPATELQVVARNAPAAQAVAADTRVSDAE
jgi:hypothetical protein